MSSHEVVNKESGAPEGNHPKPPAVGDASRSIPVPSMERQNSMTNPLPQQAPGSAAAIGHKLENSIPLSIFPLQPDKFCIALCGIPGRGKTHIARRLGRYLDFFHAIPVKVLHVADYRRRLCGAMPDADWFDPLNEVAAAKREECQMAAVQDVNVFLGQHSNGVVIVDSINETHAKRRNLTSVMQGFGAKVMWIEVNSDDEKFLQTQYRDAVRSPDYTNMSNEDAERDYRRRVGIFRETFEPLDTGVHSAVESKWSYLKCDHSKQHFVVHNVKGYLFQKVVNFIMNLRTTSHAFYLTRHGQSEYNDLGRIGGDSGLTVHGLRYAQKLAEFVDKHIVREKVTVPSTDGSDPQEVVVDVPARLWTSTMRRTKETAQFITQRTIHVPSEADPSLSYEWVQMRPRAWHHLDELFAGSCDGMTYEEIEASFPDEWERRNVDKLAYRYPRGESYLDVIARLEPIIVEMERHQERLVIVAHQGILRIIYAFYMGLSRAEAPYVSIPLNTVVQLTPRAYDCLESRHQLYRPEKALPHDGQTEVTGRKGKAGANDDDPQSH